MASKVANQNRYREKGKEGFGGLMAVNSMYFHGYFASFGLSWCELPSESHVVENCLRVLDHETSASCLLHWSQTLKRI